jgi:hypothetical protein
MYGQMDTMLGWIKDIVQRRDVNLYNHICREVERWWEKPNISLHALAYVLTPKYYHISWLAALAHGGEVKRKRHQDPKVQVGYMQALDKLLPTIQRQLSHCISGNGAFGTNHAIRD